MKTRDMSLTLSVFTYYISFFYYNYITGFGVQRSNGVVQRIRIVTVRRFTIAGWVGQSDQQEPVHFGHSIARRYKRRDINR